MEDLSNEMMPGKPVSKKMRALLNKEKDEARQRIIERGIVHFRADAEFMTALLDVADKSKIAPGTLCRRIVWTHLKSLQSAPSSELMHFELSPDVSEAVIQRLEMIKELLVQAMVNLPSAAKAPAPDVVSLASELRNGQDEIRGELRDLHEHLVGGTKKCKLE